MPLLRGGLVGGARFGAAGSSAVGFTPESGYALSGTIADGQTLTLTKAAGGFGTRGDYGGAQDFLCAGFYDFEDGEIAGGNLTTFSNAHQWSNSGTNARSGSALRFGHRTYVNNEQGGLGLASMTGTTGLWYLSFWFRLGAKSVQQGGKFVWFYGTDGVNNLSLCTGGYGSYNPAHLDLRGTGMNTASFPNAVPTVEPYWTDGDAFQENTWHKLESVWDQSTGAWTVYVDHAAKWSRDYVTNPWPGEGGSLGVGTMLDGPDPVRWDQYATQDGFYDFDDVYMDFTRARIELGNAATWAACTQREVQIPLAWSDTEIQFQCRQGGQVTLVGRYLYAVASDGTATKVGSFS